MDMENERLRTKSNSLNKSITFSFSPLLVCIYCFCSQLPKPFDGSYTYKRKKRASTNGQRSWSCVVVVLLLLQQPSKRGSREHTHNNVLIEIDEEQFEKVWQSKFSCYSCCHHRLFRNLEGRRRGTSFWGRVLTRAGSISDFTVFWLGHPLYYVPWTNPERNTFQKFTPFSEEISFFLACNRCWNT